MGFAALIPPEKVSTLVAILAGRGDEGVAEGRLVFGMAPFCFEP
jgi:hypothetical protein